MGIARRRGGRDAVGRDAVGFGGVGARVRGEIVQRGNGRREGRGVACVPRLRRVEIFAEEELLCMDGVAAVGSMHIFVDL